MIAKSPERRTALFAGTFDPFTIGHADIVGRGLQMFDEIVICLGVNANKAHDPAQVQANADTIRQLYADDPRVRVIVWEGLTAEAAREHGARFLLRGVRTDRDCDYERSLADANRQVFGLETVILFADPRLAYVSSSLVRELSAYGVDTSPLLPTTKRD